MKVLFVDDDEQLRDIVKKYFTKWGWESIGVGSVPEVLEMLDETYDVILSDIRLPRLSGLYLLKYVKELFLGLEVVLMTAYEDINATIEAVNLGAFSFIMKPLDYEQLKEILEKAASIRLARKQVQEYQNKLKKEVLDKTAELNKQKEFLTGIIQAFPSRLLIVDKDQNVIFDFQKYNDLQLPNTQGTLCELFKCHYFEIHEEKCNCFFKEEFRKILEKYEIVRNKIIEIYKRENGELVHKYIKFDFIPFNISEKCYLVSFEDVTHEKEMEIKLRLSERLAALGEMASGIAHELNQPLNGISAYIQLLDSRLQGATSLDTEKTRVIFKEILDKLTRMSDLIQEMRKFGKPSNSLNGTYIKEEEIIIQKALDIKTALNDVLKFHRSQLRSHNIICDIHSEEDIPKPIISENKVKQVFLNLLTNARDALDEKEKVLKKANEPIGEFTKKITISIEKSQKEDKKGVLISVTDNGIGVKKKDMKRILDPFYSSKSPGDGIGLGLTISYRIVKELGGELSYESNFMKGSIFKVFLPINKENVKAS